MINRAIRIPFLFVILKICICSMLMLSIIHSIWIDGFKQNLKYNTEDNLQNVLAGETIPLLVDHKIEQSFIAKGSALTNVKIYLTDLTINQHGMLILEISNQKGTVHQKKELFLSDIQSDTWYTVDTDIAGLEKGGQYKLTFYTSSNDPSVKMLYNPSNVNGDILTSCTAGGKRLEGPLAIGLSFADKYMNISVLLTSVIQLFAALLLAAPLCHTIWHIEEQVKAYRLRGNQKGLAWAFFMSASLILTFNPLSQPKLTVSSFNRQLGYGLDINIDINKIINNFFIWFLLFSIAFVAYALYMNEIKNRSYTAEQRQAWKYLDNFLVLASINLLLKCITYFAYNESGAGFFSFTSNFIYLLIFSDIAYIFLSLDKKMPFDTFKQVFWCLTGMSYPLIPISRNDESGRMLFVSCTLLTIVYLLLAKTVKYKDFKSLDKKRLLTSLSMTCCAIPLITFAYIESLNFLNQYSIFIRHPRKYYMIAIGIVLLLTGPIYLSLNKIRMKHPINWKMWAYPELILGVSFLSIQMPLRQTIGADLFESANTSILISDFLNFGKIPIVEHYGGHMLSGVIEGIIYGWINQDYAGAIFNPYLELAIPLLAILFYYLLKSLLGDDYAFWITLFFPFYNYWYYFGFGIMPCLAFVAYVKKNSYGGAFFLWITCVFGALYRLDIGFAYGIAIILTSSGYLWVTKNQSAVKQLFITFFCVVLATAAIWFILCMAKGINPLERLYEFINLSASNINWSRANLGDKHNPAFFWCYLFIPLAVAGCLSHMVFLRNPVRRMGMEKSIILFMLGISYFVNFQRGLVRHSWAEGITTIAIWSAYLFLAAFMACYLNRKKLFLIVFTGLILVDTLFISDYNFSARPFADLAAAKLSSMTDTWLLDHPSNPSAVTMWEELHAKREVVKRVEWSDDLKNQILPIQAVLNDLLDEDETYLDFINRTFMYSAINRVNPVYIAQSPGHLSGEYTQERFLDQVGKNFKNIPLAIMPLENTQNSAAFELDYIANSARYYKVSEFIYQNYRPLCVVGDVALWCQTERYQGFMEILKESMESSPDIKPIGWGYDVPLHHYRFSYLPYLWANEDRLDAIGNPVQSIGLSLGGESFYFEPLNQKQKEKGNYLLLDVSFPGNDTKDLAGADDEICTAAIKLGTLDDAGFSEKYQYELTLKEGTHRYLLRISSDYHWYSEHINAIAFSSDGEANQVRMRILEGD